MRGEDPCGWRDSPRAVQGWFDTAATNSIATSNTSLAFQPVFATATSYSPAPEPRRKSDPLEWLRERVGEVCALGTLG